MQPNHDQLTAMLPTTLTLEELADTFCNDGIETIERAGRVLRYVNLGDTYAPTLCEEDGRIFVSSWGDWFESVEQEECEDTDSVVCGYCGDFTPIEGNSWRDTRCEHCGHNVSTGKLQAEATDEDNED